MRLIIAVEFDHALSDRALADVKAAVHALEDTVAYVGGTVVKADLFVGASAAQAVLSSPAGGADVHVEQPLK